MKMNSSLLFTLLALAAGAMIPFQSTMNSALGKSLQSPYFSSLTVFIVAAVGISMYILLSGLPAPALAQFNKAPWWTYLGGILGGSYILLIVICAPKLGIGNVTVMVLLGQVLAAALIDHFGLLGASLHHLNWQRITGLVLLAIAVFIIKKY